MNEKVKDKKDLFGRAASIAVLIMAVSNILSRLLGYVRIKVLAHVAGAGSEVDAYAFAFIIPDIINHFLAGSALSITFIPIFQKYIIKGDINSERKGWRFFSNLFIIGTLFFLLFITLTYCFTDKILFFAGKNIKSPETFALTIKLTKIILPAQLFFFWGALLNGVQYAKKKFLLPAFTPLCYNIGIILGGILLFPFIGIAGFSWGVLIGAFVGNVLVQIPGALKVGMSFTMVLNFKDKDLHQYIIKTIPFIVGLSLMFSNELFLKIFGSYVKDGEGAIATLDYAYKIMFLFVGLFGQSVASGMYPFLSQLAVEKRFDELNKTLFTLLSKVIIILIPLSFILFFTSEDIIVILLRGGKFTVNDAIATTQNFKLYLIGAFFCAMVLNVNRAFFALQSTYTPMLLTTSGVLLAIPFFFILNHSMGAPGVALAISLSSFFMAVFSYGYWSWKQKNKYLPSFILKTFLIMGISAVGVLPAWYIGKLPFFEGFYEKIHYLIASSIKCTLQILPALLLTFLLLHITGLLTIKDLKNLKLGSRKKIEK